MHILLYIYAPVFLCGFVCRLDFIYNKEINIRRYVYPDTGISPR